MKNPRNVVREAGFRLDDAAAQEALSPHTMRTGRPEEGGTNIDGWVALQSLSMLIGLMVMASYFFIA